MLISETAALHGLPVAIVFVVLQWLEPPHWYYQFREAFWIQIYLFS